MTGTAVSSLTLAVLALLLLAGCSSGPRTSDESLTNTGTSAQSKASSTALTLLKPRSQEQDVVAGFYRAALEGDREEARSYWTGQIDFEGVDAWIDEYSAAKDRVEVEIGPSNLQNGTASVPVTVTVSALTKSPEGRMWSGLRYAPEGTVFIHVRQVDGAWKIIGLATPLAERPVDQSTSQITKEEAIKAAKKILSLKEGQVVDAKLDPARVFDGKQGREVLAVWLVSFRLPGGSITIVFIDAATGTSRGVMQVN